MPIPKLIKIPVAADLPADWNKLADTYFQKKEFLEYCEKYNPCNQRYYLLFKKEELIAAAVVYTLNIDLFTFSKIKSPVKMQVIGIPVSVSSSGVIGEKEDIETLIQHILKKEKGLILSVNLDPRLQVAPGIPMPILPNVEMNLSMKSWENYIQKLRSPYRRRMKRILENFKDVSEETTSCSAFSAEHYQLYLAIMKRTPNKLEIIPEDFFKNLSVSFRLTTYSVSINPFNKTMLSWYITCQENSRFYFFFGGINYDHLDKYSAYFNNLFGILKESLAQNCLYLDLGQTAEIPKMRLGGKLIPKQMFLYHQNLFVHWILRKLKYFIGYQSRFPEVSVFKKVV